MRRLFWFGAGIAAGVALTRKVNETARKATPAGMAEQVGGAMRELAGAVGSFGAEVRAGMQEREDELQDVVVNADQVRRIAADHDAERRARRAGR
ncbi:hypothetical protein E1161_24495 [Saccharopolyspora aridisoli]|uniref:YtxH domain-containing protein n=1 Tax=Saccharopolyspora aridisoli TaxID=2530385 RepID=A0A4R4U961_9PSEU|nr:hypothetical protein [Saccharopolyspora aridisoli]TDC88038.1 hypothetical protein E1161_24495 [Saccharopolyspora aridisoli]